MNAASQTLVFAGRNLRRFFRSGPNLISVLAFPLLLMFMQLATSSRIVERHASGSYVDRLAPDIVLVTAAFGATVTALAMFNDVRGGLLERVRLLPVSAFSMLAGRVVGDVAQVLLVAVIATAVAHVPGFRFEAGPLAALAYFGVIALFATMVTWVGTLVGLVLRGIDSIRAVLSNTAILLFLLSSGFVPVDAYPAAIQPLVRANPISITNDALIGLSHEGPVALPMALTVCWVVPVSAGCAALAVYRFRRLVS